MKFQNSYFSGSSKNDLIIQKTFYRRFTTYCYCCKYNRGQILKCAQPIYYVLNGNEKRKGVIRAIDIKNLIN